MTARTEINGESTSMVWPTVGSRTAKERNRTLDCRSDVDDVVLQMMAACAATAILRAHLPSHTSSVLTSCIVVTVELQLTRRGCVALSGVAYVYGADTHV